MAAQRLNQKAIGRLHGGDTTKLALQYLPIKYTGKACSGQREQQVQRLKQHI